MILSDRLHPDRDVVADVRDRAGEALAQEFATASAQVAEFVRRLAEAGDQTPSGLGERMREARRRLQEVIDHAREAAGLESFLVEPSMETVMAGARDQPLVYLIGGQQTGGAAMLVGAGPREKPVEVVWLERLTFTKVQNRMRALGSAYAGRSTNPIGWQRTLDETLAWLWSAAMGPILDALPTTVDAVTLVPCGVLRLLPWHAAWTAREGGGRNYVADRLAVAYNVNARYTSWSREAAETRSLAAGLVVDRPPRTDVPDLVHAVAEAEAVARQLSVVVRLSGTAATRAAVLDAAPDVDVVHFACHASGDPADPLDTRVLLAGHDEVTVRDLLGRNLERVRLAVLSACESATTGGGSGDEAFAVTTGFLAAGVPGAIGSLWAVNDASAAAFVENLYAELGRGVSTAEAARRAQLAVRDASEHGRRPWAHPYYWAPFVLVGA